MVTRALLLGALAAMPTLSFSSIDAHAEGPSFDCAKVDGRAEQLICGDRELSALDVEAARLYGLVRQKTRNNETKQALDRDHTAWARLRDECWLSQDTRSCIVYAYVSRIHVLRENHPSARSHDDKGITSGPYQVQCETLEQPLKATFIHSDPPVGALEWRDAVHISVADGGRYVERNAPEGEGLAFAVTGQQAQLALPDGKKYSCEIAE